MNFIYAFNLEKTLLLFELVLVLKNRDNGHRYALVIVQHDCVGQFKYVCPSVFRFSEPLLPMALFSWNRAKCGEQSQLARDWRDRPNRCRNCPIRRSDSAVYD